MIPWLQIDTTRVPGADVELRLMRRGAEFSMMLGHNELMNRPAQRIGGGARDARLSKDRRRQAPAWTSAASEIPPGTAELAVIEWIAVPVGGEEGARL